MYYSVLGVIIQAELKIPRFFSLYYNICRSFSCIDTSSLYCLQLQSKASPWTQIFFQQDSVWSSFEQLWPCDVFFVTERWECFVYWYLFTVRKWKKRARGQTHKQSWERKRNKAESQISLWLHCWAEEANERTEWFVRLQYLERKKKTIWLDFPSFPVKLVLWSFIACLLCHQMFLNIFSCSTRSSNPSFPIYPCLSGVA